MKAVVTGGAGFIGSHLVEALVARNYQVTVIDDLSSGTLSNILPFVSRIRFEKGTVSDSSLLLQLLRDTDYVFHLAAIASTPRSIDNPIASHEVNVSGTLNVLQAAVHNKVKKVVFSSSAAVYGHVTVRPTTEKTIPNPSSPYAADKLAAETYCQVFERVYQLPTVCLRYFNVYGPRQDPKSQYATVVPRLIGNALEGIPLTILGDGQQTRDFVFVKDVVEVNLLAVQRDMSGIFNIGRGESISINQLAQTIIKLSGKELELVHQDGRPGDIRFSRADISKAREFGFEPKYGLEAGLADTLKWFRSK